MRINNNIMAFNAQRNLGASAMSMGKSIEKLSSGLRINRAADDASGLVISQKLRAQTSGLRQATRNAQDGISVVQTAEGALNEVHSMLNRMRDLAVQAANTGANDATARGAAQQELDQLRTEIELPAQDQCGVGQAGVREILTTWFMHSRGDAEVEVQGYWADSAAETPIFVPAKIRRGVLRARDRYSESGGWRDLDCGIVQE